MMNKKNNETTLTHLTKRFVKLLNANSDRVVNLNEASARLSVAKRRIYDITNVLEGIGLLQKTSKNVTRWVDCPKDSPFAAPPSANTNNQSLTDDTNIQKTAGLNLNLRSLPDAELLALIQTYQKLDQGINDLEASIRQQLNADGAYVTYHDIKSSFNDQTVIAVKAPPETRLEVNENLQINIKSENGQIEVFLYQHSNSHSQNNPPTPAHPQPQDVFPSTSQSTTDAVYYDPTSGVSDTYYNDPTLSSAISGEDEDPFKPLVPFEAREEPQYNFVLDENYTINSLFPDDNLGLY